MSGPFEKHTMNESTYREPGKDQKVLGHWDVIVAGGGMAGVGAAFAAARKGARVLLVERLEILGGLGTSGAVANFCFGDDSLPAGQGAVLSDIWRELADYGAIGLDNGWREPHSPPFYNWMFDHNFMAIVLQDLAEKSGVDLLFATDIIGATVEDGRIRTITLHNRSLRQSVAAEVFIDCTGDGILARHAGAEVLPPDAEHPGSIPPSHVMFVKHSQRPLPQLVKHEEPGAPPPKFSVWEGPEQIGLKMWWPGGDFDTSTGQGYSDAGRAFRRRIPEFVRHFQGTERGRDCVFAGAAPMLGMRDSLRVSGDYVLTKEDLLAGRRFPDAVAYGCFPLDSAAIAKDATPPYQIPYRSLLVKGLDNALVAGRCFSATRVALSSARIMVTSCLMGQAAGHAAAIAISGSRKLREVSAAEIRAALLAASPEDDQLRAHLSATEDFARQKSS